MPPSHAAGPSEPPLLEETIGATLRRVAAAQGDREALVARHQGIRLSYAELDAASDRLACALLALGVEQGDRIGIWAPNCAEWVLTQFATARIGAVLVNINPAYRTTELRYALAQSGCRALIAARAFKSSDYVAMVDEVRPELPALADVFWLGGAEWDALLARAGEVEAGTLATREAALSPSDPINIQYTSGTTGAPKGATLSHRNILNNGYLVGAACGYGPEDRVCIPVPFYHCFGMVMGNLGAVAHGACMVIPSAAFEPEATLAAVAEKRCTSLYGVPTMFIAELGHPSFAGPRRHRCRRRRAPTIRSRSASARSAASIRTSRCRSSTRAAPSWGAASRASCARAGTASCPAIGTTPSARPRRSTATAGCTPATSRRWTRTAT